MNFRNISPNPHIRDNSRTKNIMMMVILALMPATIFGVINFGFYSLFVIVLTVASSIFFEDLYMKLLKKPKTTRDNSAALTGLLLALNLPPSVPWWICIVGSFFAIIFVKQIFGGLGQNFMNPALGARAFLLISFTGIMTKFDLSLFAAPDAVAGATPLAVLKAGGNVSLFNMLIGTTQGTIGETCALALIFGGFALIQFKIIDYRIPASYLGSFAAFILLFGGRGFDFDFLLAHIIGGGLLLGAFFMATDYVTSPISAKGRIVFGILLGILTGVFRIFGASAEGVSYAIIFGNLLVPLIDKVTVPKPFGYIKPAKKAKGEA